MDQEMREAFTQLNGQISQLTNIFTQHFSAQQNNQPQPPPETQQQPGLDPATFAQVAQMMTAFNQINQNNQPPSANNAQPPQNGQSYTPPPATLESLTALVQNLSNKFNTPAGTATPENTGGAGSSDKENF